MVARLLEGRPVADAIWNTVSAGAAEFQQAAGRPPTLALVSDADEAAAAYGRQIERQFVRRGLAVSRASVEADDFLDHLRGLNADSGIDGILLLTPLPSGVSAEAAVLAIDPAKDVDGQHPMNLGRIGQRRPAFAPATALGGLRLLKHYDVPLSGTRVVVVGRSPVVGMPLALLLTDADATVTVCHSRTREIDAVTRSADLLCVAMGRAGFITPEHVKPGAVVVDFGTNPTPDGSLVGDVQTEAVAEIASAITPVPGGAGPTTVAVLAEQTLRARRICGVDIDARAHLRLVGRVQGVGFRYATADEARRRRLNGWVRNLDSGAVEAVFEGPHAQVAEMVRWCEDGPPGAYVRDVRVDWDEPLEQLRDFEIRPTSIS